MTTQSTKKLSLHITGNFLEAKMKISAIQAQNYKSIQNSKNKSFGAKVNIIREVTDSISGSSVSLKEGPLKRMAEKLAKTLEKFDDNLIFVISGTKKFDSFLDIFRPEVNGLKVDIHYFDQKKAYWDIIHKPKQEQLLKEITIRGLKRQDDTLLYQLSRNIGVGKFFRPKTETENQYVEKLVNMIKQDLIYMPKRLLESKNIKLEPNGAFAAWSGGNYHKGTDCRDVCSWYRGIEY